ncbi:MAG: aldehyde dehydrogenase family protein [Alphaproteobacteria bacterium]|nr:aldehyde dehydrogenase family protein [Alphaproteobacteria bacterium]
MPQAIVSTNPATKETLGQVSVTTSKQLSEIIASAKKAQKAWQETGLSKRVSRLRAVVELFVQYKKELSEITCLEMGRPLASCKGLHDYTVEQFKWNLDHAAEYLASETTYEEGSIINEVVYEPWGVVACIMAWNFPILNFVYSVVQPLIAGNSVVVKYSEEIPLFSQKLEEICKEADLPEGVLSFVYGDGAIGEALTDEDVDLIIFTGSSQTGNKLRIKAAQKGIPAILEMGGSSPGVVFSDVDLTDFIKSIYALRFDNSGQFCDNLKRLIVHEDLFDACIEKLALLAQAAKIGLPMDPMTEMGPLVAERQVANIESQVQDALEKGAKLVCGGKRPKNLDGAFYEPTLLTNVTKDMRVWKEEVFGPVLPIVSFKTYEEAMQLANDTLYGLTAYIFTNDKKISTRATVDIRAGCISVNGLDYFKPQNPFGGYKQSGAGRENGKWGFHDVCQVKMVAREK